MDGGDPGPVTLSLPADLEAHADDYAQLTSPGVYALRLEKPDAPEWAIAETWDVWPSWGDEFVAADAIAYVGASSNVLGRLEDHRDGEVRKAALLRICEIDGIHSVWFYDDVDLAFDREWQHATKLQHERPAWYVHSR